MGGRFKEHSTENPNNCKSSINYGAVCGNTYSHLKEQLSILDIPALSYRLFQNIETELGDQFTRGLWPSIEKAGRKEEQIAIQQGQNTPDGLPWVTVCLDGRWSHRSYGHNYNAGSVLLLLPLVYIFLSMHGMRFMHFIGDGQSAEKLTCLNHAVKNFGKHLYNCINCQGKEIINEKKK